MQAQFSCTRRTWSAQHASLTCCSLHVCQEYEREVKFLRTLRHRNIVLFHGAGVKNDKRMLVTEFVERGSLRDYLDDDKVRGALWRRELPCRFQTLNPVLAAE